MKPFASLAVAAALSMSSIAVAGELDRTLQRVLDRTAADETVSALVFMSEQSDVASLLTDLRREAADRTRRNEEVVRLLQDTAALTQRQLREELQTRRATGDVQAFESFWIANVLRVQATPQALRDIAARADVLRVYLDAPLDPMRPILDDQFDPELNERSQAGSVLPGLAAVRAPEVWAMGYTGQGVLVASIDTGVDGDHPALASRWRGLDPAYADNPQWAWFDPYTATSFPVDFGSDTYSHGTHTMGTIVGGSPGDQIGLAPDAQWIHAAVTDRGLGNGIEGLVSGALAAFQWMAAPTGVPGDTWAVPRVCSNSWGVLHTAYPQCDDVFWEWIDNGEAAGTAHFFAAGNEGQWNQPLRRPADRATNDYHSIAVAAVSPHNPSFPAASFSSRGPTNCTPDGSEAIKPDLAGPGVNIRSAIDDGLYANYSGTSMAAPHVAGVAALVLSACDALTPDELKQILIDTAIDLGDPGKDNTYGWGMIDAAAAVDLALAQCSLSIEVQDHPTLLQPGEPAPFAVFINQANEAIVPGSAVLMHRLDDGPFHSIPLSFNGSGAYTATIPAMPCGTTVEYYVQVLGDGGSLRTSPPNAPDVLYTAHVGELISVNTFHENFSTGMPSNWTATGLWNVTSLCPIAQPCSGTHWAYYGKTDTCDYDTGLSSNSGAMTSDSLLLPNPDNLSRITVSFCYTLMGQGSPTYDVATFSVVGESGFPLPHSPDMWLTHTEDITHHAGEEIQLRWHFATVNSTANHYHGWQVDNIRIDVTTLECDFTGPPCVADITGDQNVGVDDLLMVLASWGWCPGCDADLTGDGTVTIGDMLILLQNWGACQ